MPSTRSQGQAQPTLPFPRRRSCRVSSRSKMPQQAQSPVSSPSKPGPVALTHNGPLSPRRHADLPPPLSPRCPTERLTPLSPKGPVSHPSPLSPRRPAAPPSSPSLQTRLPLSPRKRTGNSPDGRKLPDTPHVGATRQCKRLVFSLLR